MTTINEQKRQLRIAIYDHLDRILVESDRHALEGLAYRMVRLLARDMTSNELQQWAEKLEKLEG